MKREHTPTHSSIDLKALRGPYNVRCVDSIEVHVVTEEMINKALKQGASPYRDRKMIRRNIAIGIRCGSYPGD